MNRLARVVSIIHAKQRRAKLPLWRTGAGVVIPISEMTDQHLRNSLHYMQRESPLYVDKIKLRWLEAEYNKRMARGKLGHRKDRVGL